MFVSGGCRAHEVEVGEVGCRCEEDGVKGEDGCRVFGYKRVPGYFFFVYLCLDCGDEEERGKKEKSEDRGSGFLFLSSLFDKIC